MSARRPAAIRQASIVDLVEVFFDVHPLAFFDDPGLMPSQCLPRAFSSNFSNTCSRRAIGLASPGGGSRMPTELASDEAFASFASAFVNCFSASYVSRSSSRNASWSEPASAMSSSPR